MVYEICCKSTPLNCHRAAVKEKNQKKAQFFKTAAQWHSAILLLQRLRTNKPKKGGNLCQNH